MATKNVLARRKGVLHQVYRRLAATRGMTLVELCVVILIAGILAGAMYGIYQGMVHVFYSQSVRIQNQDDARLAINQVTRYLRSATSSADNQTSQSNSVATALPYDIEFYCDIDGDAVAEKIRYYLSGTSLWMQTVTPQWLTSPEPHWEYPAYTTNGEVVQDAISNRGTEPDVPVFLFYRYNEATGGLDEFSPTTAALRKQVVTVAVNLVVNGNPTLARSDVRLATRVEIRQRYQGGLE